MELWSVTALPPDDGVVLHAEDRRPLLSRCPGLVRATLHPVPQPALFPSLGPLGSIQMTLGQEVSCPDALGSETLIAADIAALDLFHKPPFVLFGGFQMCLGQEMRHPCAFGSESHIAADIATEHFLRIFSCQSCPLAIESLLFLDSCQALCRFHLPLHTSVVLLGLKVTA